MVRWVCARALIDSVWLNTCTSRTWRCAASTSTISAAVSEALSTSCTATATQVGWLLPYSRAAAVEKGTITRSSSLAWPPPAPLAASTPSTSKGTLSRRMRWPTGSVPSANSAACTRSPITATLARLCSSPSSKKMPRAVGHFSACSKSVVAPPPSVRWSTLPRRATTKPSM
ncbi:hypothetical protein D9M68_859750 [compost metagenome]